MHIRHVLGAALALVTLAACARLDAATPGLTPSGVRADVAAATVPPAVSVAGTYKGPIEEVEGSQSRTGSVTIVIQESGKKISGTFDVTFGSHTTDLTLSGSVKSDKAKKAKIAFVIDDPKGRYAVAKASVTARKLVGKGTVPPSGTKPGVSITYKTARSGAV
jgi:hypothetical protein